MDANRNPLCTSCGRPLVEAQRGGQVVWACSTCGYGTPAFGLLRGSGAPPALPAQARREPDRIQFSCPVCRKRLAVELRHAGKSVACPDCSATLFPWKDWALAQKVVSAVGVEAIPPPLPSHASPRQKSHAERLLLPLAVTGLFLLSVLVALLYMDRRHAARSTATAEKVVANDSREQSAAEPPRPSLPLHQLGKAQTEVPATVFPIPELPEKSGWGTGFVVAPSYLLTNRHVVEGAQFLGVVQEVHGSYELLGAVTVSKSSQADLALLCCPLLTAPAIPLRPDGLARGVDLAVFGYPLSRAIGSPLKLTRGTLTALPNQETFGTFLLDAAINRGNSGGPVCDDTGAVIGIATHKLAFESGLGTATPAGLALEFVRQSLPQFTSRPLSSERKTWTSIDQEVSRSVFKIIRSDDD